MFAGNMVKVMKVKGFVPVLIAAVAIGVVSWLINGVVGLLDFLVRISDIPIPNGSLR